MFCPVEKRIGDTNSDSHKFKFLSRVFINTAILLIPHAGREEAKGSKCKRLHALYNYLEEFNVVVFLTDLMRNVISSYLAS